MIKLSQYGDVLRIDSARTLAGRGYYWSTAYLIDGLLIDTGCAHSAGELIRALDSKEIVSVVNTHTHEDHIGANGVLQKKQKGLNVFAHPLALPVLGGPMLIELITFGHFSRRNLVRSYLRAES